MGGGASCLDVQTMKYLFSFFKDQIIVAVFIGGGDDLGSLTLTVRKARLENSLTKPPTCWLSPVL